MRFNFGVAFFSILIIGVTFILFLDRYIPANMEYIRVLLFIILISIPPILSNSVGLEKIGKNLVNNLIKYIIPIGYIILILNGIFQIYTIFYK